MSQALQSIEMPATDLSQPPTAAATYVLHPSFHQSSFVEAAMNTQLQEKQNADPQLLEDLKKGVCEFWSLDSMTANTYLTPSVYVWMRFCGKLMFAVLNICYVHMMFVKSWWSAEQNLIGIQASLWHLKIAVLGCEMVSLNYIILRLILQSLLSKFYLQNPVLLVSVVAEGLTRIECFSVARFMPILTKNFGHKIKISFVSNFLTHIKAVRIWHCPSAVSTKCFRRMLKFFQNLSRCCLVVLSPISILIKLERFPAFVNFHCAEPSTWLIAAGFVNQMCKIQREAWDDAQAVFKFITILNVGIAKREITNTTYMSLLSLVVNGMVQHLGIFSAIALWTTMSSSHLATIVHFGGPSVQKQFFGRVMYELVKELEALRRCPKVRPFDESQKDLESHIDVDVLQKVLELCWTYSLNGIEGHRAGHIIIVGDAEKVMKYGKIVGRNAWEGEPKGYIQKDGGDRDVLVEMNQDGAHVINGRNGQICANKFFSSKIEAKSGGGAGAAAAAALSCVAPAVVFKISSDGSIKEFRKGVPEQHCGNRVYSANKSRGFGEMMGW